MSKSAEKPNRLLHFSSMATLALLALASAGCENAEDRQLASAQSCLDKATDSTAADQCLSIVEGLENESAYLIRCSANFVAQGFTGSRVATAFNSLKNKTDSEDPMASMLSYVVFAKNLPNHSADKALENCEKSGVRSMVRLATIAKMATFMADPSGLANLAGTAYDPASGSFDTSQLAAQLNNLKNNATTEQKEQIGSLVVTAESAYCNEGSAFKQNEICEKLSAAVGNASSTAEIGQLLLNYLQPQ